MLVWVCRVAPPVYITIVMGTTIVAMTHSLDLHSKWDPVVFGCMAVAGVEFGSIVLVRVNTPLWVYPGVADYFSSLALRGLLLFLVLLILCFVDA